MAKARVRRVKVPQSVQVSYQRIKISVGPCEDLGNYHTEDHVIRIREKLKWTEEANTLLHELLHAIYHCYTLDRKADEEKIVCSMANGLMEVMARNPEILNYFTKVWNAK